jgi:hypothetical protein
MSVSFLRNVTADDHSPAGRLLARIPRKALLVSLVLTLALSNVLAPNFAAAMGLSPRLPPPFHFLAGSVCC